MSLPPGHEGRVLALDVGEKRVGVAVSDPSGTLARPLDTVAQHPRPAHFAELKRLVSEYCVNTVVVGNPISLDGTEGPQARRIRRYRAALTAALPVPVVAWDERFSTITARDLLQQARDSRLAPRRPAPRRDLDAAAAAVILQSYLDAFRQRKAEQDEAQRAERSHPASERAHASSD